MTGATTAAASRLAGSEASETCSKCSAISGAVADGRRDRDRGDLRDRPRHAPARERAAQAGREREQARDRGERELPARLPDGERVQRERDGGREAERVPARGRAPGQRGDEPRDAHDAGALDRRPAAGERHVDRDDQHRGDQPRLQRQAGDGAERQDEHAEQQHVLAADRQQMREPRPLEVGLRRLADRLVLAEHHAAQQRRLRRAEPGAQRARRALAGGVERPGEAAARAPGGRPGGDLDGGAGAAPALVALEVRERRDGAAHAQLAADARARRRPPVLRPRHRHLALEPSRAHEPDARDRGPAAPGADGLEQDRPRVDPVPGQRRQPAAAERRHARLGQRGAREHGERGGERQRHAPAQRGRRHGRRQHHRRRRDRAQQQPGDEREQHEMARMPADRLAPRDRRAPGASRDSPYSQRHLLAQRREALVADPGDLAELLDRAEAAALFAEVEDLLRGQRTDPAERVELLERRRVEVERLARRRRGRRPRSRGAAAPPRPRRARSGTSTWRPSSSSAARLSPPRSARRVAPPARCTASSTRAPDAACRPRAAGRRRRRGSRAGRRHRPRRPRSSPRRGDAATGLAAAAPQLAEAEHDHQHGAGDAERELAGSEVGHAPKLGGRV